MSNLRLDHVIRGTASPEDRDRLAQGLLKDLDAQGAEVRLVDEQPETPCPGYGKTNIVSTQTQHGDVRKTHVACSACEFVLSHIHTWPARTRTSS